jgi:hypothetical protein
VELDLSQIHLFANDLKDRKWLKGIYPGFYINYQLCLHNDIVYFLVIIPFYKVWIDNSYLIIHPLDNDLLSSLHTNIEHTIGIWKVGFPSFEASVST